MLLISCVWYLALLCHLLSLDMLCVNATCLVSNYHICELCNAILLQDIIYVNYAMLSCCKGIIYVNYATPCCLANHHVCELYHAIFFCITCSICRHVCIFNYSSCASSIWSGDGSIRSENKVFGVDNATCWSRHLAGYRELLRGGFRDWWPVLFPPWGLCSNLAGLYYPCHACCLALLSFYIIYGLPSAYLLTI